MPRCRSGSIRSKTSASANDHIIMACHEWSPQSSGAWMSNKATEPSCAKSPWTGSSFAFIKSNASLDVWFRLSSKYREHTIDMFYVMKKRTQDHTLCLLCFLDNFAVVWCTKLMSGWTEWNCHIKSQGHKVNIISSYLGNTNLDSSLNRDDIKSI